ncbi:TPA: hypothetical protein DEO28_04895 [Candidatus Dependentiae bacterium]|nr:MAG: D-arabino-3-hexulose 6-phosphate formaldehyde lyase / 6-phospho-3-hexuloisomerase [candidate division TM6 bacterium GW2011_GWE2_31_21]KKP53889.1 MAG: D-arabino-3-hexulose 6-phosphate formaldehyde lyase / 6-phospho-3-hexuloisomerase [candidate division TM6 bacterium GW2011_GWF2_33_332]HBS47669.1 hypothetical protein [Candidatus Dependentiae bacterium]HBZ73818.1 hypothetical protein [Candidatus Dependentiae bacterium]
MKLQITYDFTNLQDALDIAQKTAPHADILEVGTLLLYKEGIKAVEEFKKLFPKKEILVDAKISDRAEEAVKIFTKAGATIITVLAGTQNKTIYKATQIAHENDAKIALDLMDAYSMGQSAMDAAKLGVDYILFNRSHDVETETSIIDQWESIKENTNIPVLISGKINNSNIQNILSLKPYGIVIGTAITKSEYPEKEAEFFKSLL